MFKELINLVNNIDYDKTSVVRIKNTLALAEIEVSGPMVESLKDVKGIEILNNYHLMKFDGYDNLF